MIEVTVEINSGPGSEGKVIGHLLIGRQILKDTEVANYNFDLWKNGEKRAAGMPVYLGFDLEDKKSFDTHPDRIVGKVKNHVRGKGVWELIRACLNEAESSQKSP